LLKALMARGGVVREVKMEGLLPQVDIDVNEPIRVVSIITRESLDELGLRPGMEVTAVVKSTSVDPALTAKTRGDRHGAELPQPAKRNHHRYPARRGNGRDHH
jgi:molybdopterin-binding protein